MTLRIRRYPESVLLTKADHVPTAEEVKSVLHDMFRIMYLYNGVGLAAPQVGLPWRLAVANPEGRSTRPDLEQVWIDPRIESCDGQQPGSEGCLSVPKLRHELHRPNHVVLNWLGLDGERHTQEFTEFEARIACHEVDHLDGLLFVDRLNESGKSRVEPILKVMRGEKG